MVWKYNHIHPPETPIINLETTPNMIPEINTYVFLDPPNEHTNQFQIPIDDPTITNHSIQPHTSANIKTHATYHTNHPTRTSLRVRHHPSYLQDCICNSTATSKQASKGILYPMSNFISHHKLSPMHPHYSFYLMSNIEPTNFIEASKHKCWK